ncbi:MAG: hypothetical protein V4710_13820 [Verrucomicrobiota bacterium]
MRTLPGLVEDFQHALLGALCLSRHGSRVYEDRVQTNDGIR